MTHRSLAWRLFPTFLGVVLLCSFGVGLYAMWSARSFYISHVSGFLLAQARMVEHDVAGHLNTPATASANLANSRDQLDDNIKQIGKTTGARITLMDSAGSVIADSSFDPGKLGSHADRPEFRQALAQGYGEATRYSVTAKGELKYVAIASKDDQGNRLVVRTALPLDEINSALMWIYARTMLASLIVAVAASFMGVLIVKRVSHPLKDMTRGARRFADGDFNQKLPVPAVREFAMLAEAMNAMAAQLDQKIHDILQQRNEQGAVLSSMTEGVLAVDTEERVISLNSSAAQFIGIQASDVIGKPLQESVRNINLGRFVWRALRSSDPVEDEILLHDGGRERVLQIRSTTLRGAGGQDIGALLVFNDVTRLHQLENMRRDFVANVSHELKTPITSIKGFVETLREGALGDEAKAVHFLEIISRQAERLDQIIDDLLTLSRIERETEKQMVERFDSNLPAVLRAAVDDCLTKATERNVRIQLECPADLRARVNPQLIEQAVVNLLDNAIKYSEPQSTIELSAQRSDRQVVIRVTDHGCGIPPEHLGRIFERFYRVDKARSRELGGTGLGLAIVKHISQAHGGKITVESTVGVGSTFTILLPE